MDRGTLSRKGFTQKKMHVLRRLKTWELVGRRPYGRTLRGSNSDGRAMSVNRGAFAY